MTITHELISKVQREMAEAAGKILAEMEQRRAESPILQWVHDGMPVETEKGSTLYLDPAQAKRREKSIV